MTAALLPALAGARELATSTRAPDVKPFELDEMTIADLQAGMSSGKFTARSITEKYLTRIDAIDKQGPAINSGIVGDAWIALYKRCFRCSKVARGWSSYSRQDQSQRVGEHSLQPFLKWMERTWRPNKKSLRPRSQSLWL